MGTKSLATFLLIACNAFSAVGQSNLELTQSRDDIFIFTNPKGSSATIEYKAHTLIKNTTIDKVLRVFTNYEGHTEWLYNCEESKLLDQENDIAYLYQVCNATWPFRNRDYVLKLKKTHQSPSRTTITFSAIDSMLPTKKNRVRLDHFTGYWLLEQKETHVKVSMYCEFDPNLSMPKGMRKAYAIKIPFHTLRDLRRSFED
ncbi:MAG: START domain-containing protein [Gilvibacter sp.]